MKYLMKRMVDTERGLMTRFSSNHSYELFTTEEKRQKHIENWAKKHPRQKDFCARWFRIQIDFFHRRYYFIAKSSIRCLRAPELKAFYPVFKSEDYNYIMVPRKECKKCEHYTMEKNKRYCLLWRANNRGDCLNAIGNAIKEANRIMGGIR